MERNRSRVHQVLSSLERLTSKSRIIARGTQFISTPGKSLQQRGVEGVGRGEYLPFSSALLGSLLFYFLCSLQIPPLPGGLPG